MIDNFWTRLVDLKKFNRGLARIDRSYYEGIIEEHDISSLLDVGCGFGETRRVITRDLKYIGLDLTRQFLKGVENPVNGRAEHLPFPDNSFEMVTCRAVLEHVLNPDPVISEMVRVTTDLIVIVWFIEPDRGETLRHDKRGFWNNRHDRVRVMNSLRGFEMISKIIADRHTVWIMRREHE